MDLSILLLIGVLPFMAYLFYRNEAVYKLRRAILDEEADYNRHLIGAGQWHWETNFHQRFQLLPSYDRMLYSFWKPVSRFEAELPSLEEVYNGL